MVNQTRELDSDHADVRRAVRHPNHPVDFRSTKAGLRQSRPLW